MALPNSCLRRAGLFAGSALLAACTVLPSGPSVMVLPGTGQSIDRFREDDGFCRQYAQIQIGGKTPEQSANQSMASSAAVGTAIGAVAGAAIGGSAQGAAVGAGSGLVVGSAVGMESAWTSGYGTQRQYDNAYIQCMYSKGHRVPVPGNVTYSRPLRAGDAGLPPPPPGAPPPPPANVR